MSDPTELVTGQIIKVPFDDSLDSYIISDEPAHELAVHTNDTNDFSDKSKWFGYIMDKENTTFSDIQEAYKNEKISDEEILDCINDKNASNYLMAVKNIRNKINAKKPEADTTPVDFDALPTVGGPFQKPEKEEEPKPEPKPEDNHKPDEPPKSADPPVPDKDREDGSDGGFIDSDKKEEEEPVVIDFSKGEDDTNSEKEEEINRKRQREERARQQKLEKEAQQRQSAENLDVIREELAKNASARNAAASKFLSGQTDMDIPVLKSEYIISFTLMDSDQDVYNYISVGGTNAFRENTGEMYNNRCTGMFDNICQFGLRAHPAMEANVLCGDPTMCELMGAMLLYKSQANRIKAVVTAIDDSVIKVGNPIRMYMYDEHPFRMATWLREKGQKPEQTSSAGEGTTEKVEEQPAEVQTQKLDLEFDNYCLTHKLDPQIDISEYSSTEEEPVVIDFSEDDTKTITKDELEKLTADKEATWKGYQAVVKNTNTAQKKVDQLQKEFDAIKNKTGTKDLDPKIQELLQTLTSNLLKSERDVRYLHFQR